MIKAEWTNADALDLQPTCNKLATDTISRQGILNWLKTEWDGMVVSVFDGVRNMPSAQPEIIRCKDCKFYSPMNRETKTGICNLTMHQNFGDDWFCAGAERRTDEQIR